MPKATPTLMTLGEIYRSMDIGRYLNKVPYTRNTMTQFIDPIPPTPSGTAPPPGKILNMVREELSDDISGIIDNTPTPVYLYGPHRKLLCLSYSTPGSNDMMGHMKACNLETIELTTDIPSGSTASALNILYSVIVYLEDPTNLKMCTYPELPPNPGQRLTHLGIMTYGKRYLAKNKGMRTMYGGDVLMEYYIDIDQPSNTISLNTVNPNNYFMFFWDTTENIIAAWILIEYIEKGVGGQPDKGIHDNIHADFNHYIHITAFCGNTPAGSSGATTFIAMLMHLCISSGTVYEGIVLDSVTNVETLSIYYALGFRSIIEKGGNAVYADSNHIMVWRNPNPGCSFPDTKYEIHRNTPSRRIDPHGGLSDFRVFLAIAMYGYPLSNKLQETINGSHFYAAITGTVYYREFGYWLSTGKVAEFTPGTDTTNPYPGSPRGKYGGYSKRYRKNPPSGRYSKRSHRHQMKYRHGGTYRGFQDEEIWTDSVVPEEYTIPRDDFSISYAKDIFVNMPSGPKPISSRTRSKTHADDLSNRINAFKNGPFG